MARLGLATAILAAALTSACAAELPPPICGRPAVLAQLAAELRQAGRSVTFDPVPVSETSDLGGRRVVCAAQVHMVAYDTPRYGARALIVPFVVRYQLDLRENGIFLRLL